MYVAIKLELIIRKNRSELKATPTPPPLNNEFGSLSHTHAPTA